MKDIRQFLTEAQESKITEQNGKLIFPLEIEFVIENDPKEFFDDISDPSDPVRIADDVEEIIYARIGTNLDKYLKLGSKMEFILCNNYDDITVELDSSYKNVFDKYLKLGISKKDLKNYISNQIEGFVQLYNLNHKYL